MIFHYMFTIGHLVTNLRYTQLPIFLLVQSHVSEKYKSALCTFLVVDSGAFSGGHLDIAPHLFHGRGQSEMLILCTRISLFIRFFHGWKKRGSRLRMFILEVIKSINSSSRCWH